MKLDEVIKRLRAKKNLAMNLKNGEKTVEAYDTAIRLLESQMFDVEKWLSSFNTDSATECFTAIQKLKMEVNADGK